MYGITYSTNIFADELINFLIDWEGFKHSQRQIYIYYKYAPDVSKLLVLSYYYDFVYCYTYKLVKWFVDTLGKRLHVKLIGYANCYSSIMTS